MHYDSMSHAQIASLAVEKGLFKSHSAAMMQSDHATIALSLAYLDAVQYTPNPRRVVRGRKPGRRIRTWARGPLSAGDLMWQQQAVARIAARHEARRTH